MITISLGHIGRGIASNFFATKNEPKNCNLGSHMSVTVHLTVCALVLVFVGAWVDLSWVPGCLCAWVLGCLGVWLCGCLCVWAHWVWMLGCVGAWLLGFRVPGCLGASVLGSLGARPPGCFGGFGALALGCWGCLL